MGCARVREHSNHVSVRVVERLIVGPVKTIAVKADGDCFRQHEAVGPRRVALGKSYVVEAYHIGCHLLPSAHAYSRCEAGSFDFQPVAVPLLVSFKWRQRVASTTGICDIP